MRKQLSVLLATVVMCLCGFGITTKAEEIEIPKEQFYEWFSDETWQNADDAFKEAACLYYADYIAKQNGIETPAIIFEELPLANAQTVATYYPDGNISYYVVYNPNYIHNEVLGNVVMATVAHEIRHCYQMEEINKETEWGLELKEAYLEYTLSDINDYFSSPLEIDAYDYAFQQRLDFYDYHGYEESQYNSATDNTLYLYSN